MLSKSCPCELIGIGYDLYCSFVGGIPARVKEYYECCQSNTRPAWCPLSEVPPHGRLIDADALYKELDSIDTDENVRLSEIQDMIFFSDTIIEADGE